MIESHTDAAQGSTTTGHLATIADELLEHTRALRRQHEQLRDRLAGIAAVRPDEPFEERRGAPVSVATRNGSEPQQDLYPMVLQMALAGETRDYAREQLLALEVEDPDELVNEVFDRIESQRTNGRRRLFARKSD